MERDHALEECCLCVDDVFNRLAGHRIRQEADEIAGMPRLEGDTDLTLRLEASDARAVSSTRINNNEWPLVLVYFGAIRRRNAHEEVVYRSRQLSPVHDELATELQDVRCNLGGMFLITVAALLQDVQKKDGALLRVNPVIPAVVSQMCGRQLTERFDGGWERWLGHGFYPHKPPMV